MNKERARRLYRLDGQSSAGDRSGRSSREETACRRQWKTSSEMSAG